MIAYLALVAWLVAALLASASGVAGRLHPPVPQVIVVALTVALIVAERLVAPVRRAVAGASTRGLVALHVTRLVGGAFLYYAGRGDLPHDFAVPAGWGDIVVAVFAIVVLLVGGDPLGPRRGLWLMWNAVGVTDLVFVVGNAARIAFAAPASMAAMLRLPMSLLPLFLVPILLASHVWIYRRLLARSGT